MATMTVSALAKAGGVGVETIRYYQRRGLLETPATPQNGGVRGGVRRYSEEDLRRLSFIRSAQAAGFTLYGIGELLELDATADRTRIRAMASQRLAALDAKIADLITARVVLQELATACDAGSYGPCPILKAFDPRIQS